MRCPVCRMEFTAEEALSTHQTEMHNALSNVELTCTLCGYQTEDAVEMETHKKSHPDVITQPPYPTRKQK